MNIWRFAGIVAASCAFAVLAFVVAFGVYTGKFMTLQAHDVFEMLGFAALLALFIVALITFPYYWFKTARIMFLGWAYAIDRKARLSAKEIQNDIIGMIASCLLIGITLWLGNSFFSSGH